MSTHASKIISGWHTGLMAVLAFVICGCQTAKTSFSPAASTSIYRETLRTSVIQSQPWKQMRTTREEVEAPEVWRNQRHRFEYRPDEDVAGTLLAEARKGNAVAMSKLEFYVREFEPNWSHRFELKKMQALRRGVAGIARFYSETRQARALRIERRAIELALQQIEGDAEQGSLIDAVVFYQFCGSLAETKHELPGRSNLGASAKALELIASHSGISVMKKVAASEALRLGFAQQQFLNGDYYPHTPEGWAPTKALKPLRMQSFHRPEPDVTKMPSR